LEACEKSLAILSSDGVKLQIVKRQQSLLQSRVITKQTEYEEARANINEFNVSLVWSGLTWSYVIYIFST
jgi:hypothetical protein